MKFKEDYRMEILPFGTVSREQQWRGKEVCDIDGKTFIPYEDFIAKYGTESVLLCSQARLKYFHKCTDLSKSFMRLSMAYVDWNHPHNTGSRYVHPVKSDVDLIFCLKCTECGFSVTLDEFEIELRNIQEQNT